MYSLGSNFSFPSLLSFFLSFFFPFLNILKEVDIALSINLFLFAGSLMYNSPSPSLSLSYIPPPPVDLQALPGLKAPPGI